MSETTDLEAAARRAEEELDRAREYFSLTGTRPDASLITKLSEAANDANAAAAAARAAEKPVEKPVAGGAPRRVFRGALMGAETTELVATVTRRMDRLATSMAHLY